MATSSAAAGTFGYIWGTNDGQDFLEYLAQHRMTDDQHVRIWASGRIEQLPAPGPYLAAANATNEERERSKQLAIERNRLAYADLRAKGLLPSQGHNLPAHNINEYLRSGNEPAVASDRGLQQASDEPPLDGPAST